MRSMCGIAGMAGHSGPIHRYYGTAGMMLEKLTRRGPDKGEIVFSKGACLLRHGSAGGENESMEWRRGGDASPRRYILSFAGELYNAGELRGRLEERGRRMKGRSDGELVLTAYAEWGPDCVRELNGVYAFAIWEEESETLFCARDRFGIRPFFYALERDIVIIQKNHKG